MENILKFKKTHYGYQSGLFTKPTDNLFSFVYYNYHVKQKLLFYKT